MGRSYVYDIRTSESALSTLVNFTQVVPPIWDKYISRQREYRYNKDLVEDVIRKHGTFPENYENWIFTYFHVTTSANKCASFNEHGILDLKNSYRCADSELRTFLDNRGIEVDIDNCILKYNGKVFDISYGPCPPSFDTKAKACWSIGRKFYYDFTTCGFLSVWDLSPYGGYVHCRPEILSDIDNLLNLTLSQEWHVTHDPYEVVALVRGTDIVYDGDDDQSDRDKVINYLTKAYNTAFGAPHEEIVLLKNNIQVPPQNIIEINPLSCW